VFWLFGTLCVFSPLFGKTCTVSRCIVDLWTEGRRYLAAYWAIAVSISLPMLTEISVAYGAWLSGSPISNGLRAAKTHTSGPRKLIPRAQGDHGHFMGFSPLPGKTQRVSRCFECNYSGIYLDTSSFSEQSLQHIYPRVPKTHTQSTVSLDRETMDTLWVLFPLPRKPVNCPGVLSAVIREFIWICDLILLF